jgi:hypothetical protein
MAASAVSACVRVNLSIDAAAAAALQCLPQVRPSVVSGVEVWTLLEQHMSGHVLLLLLLLLLRSLILLLLLLLSNVDAGAPQCRVRG